MVIVLEDHVAVTPGGNPEGEAIPVAPAVLCVMAVKAVLMHNVGVLDAAPTEQATLMVPVNPPQLAV
jgi:hypothetical protein